MARKKHRTRAKRKAAATHSPSRRKALKGIAAYIGDKVVGGVIGGAAFAGTAAVVSRALTSPATTTVTVLRKITLSLEPASFHLTGQNLVVKVVPKGEPDPV